MFERSLNISLPLPLCALQFSVHSITIIMEISGGGTESIKLDEPAHAVMIKVCPGLRRVAVDDQQGATSDQTSKARRVRKKTRFGRAKGKGHRSDGVSSAATSAPPKSWSKDAVRKREARKENAITKLQNESKELKSQLSDSAQRETDLAERLKAAIERVELAEADSDRATDRADRVRNELQQSEETVQYLLEQTEKLETKLNSATNGHDPQTRQPNGQFTPAFERAMAEAVTKGLSTTRASEIAQVFLSFAWQRKVSKQELPSTTHNARLKKTAGTLAAAVAFDAVRSDAREPGGPGQTLSIDQTTKRNQSLSTVNITTTASRTYLLGVQPTADKSAELQIEANRAMRQRAVSAGLSIFGPATGTQTETANMMEDVVAVFSDEGPTEKAMVRELQIDKDEPLRDMGFTEQEIKENKDGQLFQGTCVKHVDSQFTSHAANTRLRCVCLCVCARVRVYPEAALTAFSPVCLFATGNTCAASTSRSNAL